MSDYTILVGPEAFGYSNGFTNALQGASSGGDVGPGTTISFQLNNRTGTVQISLDPSGFDRSSLTLSTFYPSGDVVVTETEGAGYWFQTDQVESGGPIKPSPGTMAGSVDVILKDRS